VIEGRVRRQDCGQVTDGAVGLVVASPEFAAEYRRKRNISDKKRAVIEGWGHATAGLSLESKLVRSQENDFVIPHIRTAITDAYQRAGISGPEQLDAIETHDCFSMTEYMAIDHFGLTPPGENWKVIEDGTIAMGGRLPINPSGGLIGLGHPVGATGVRMVLDCARQVTGRAGDCQVEGARDFATLNVGGSACTVVSFVVGR
jgi:acetyl-CoA C-acetyltransferase